MFSTPQYSTGIESRDKFGYHCKAVQEDILFIQYEFDEGQIDEAKSSWERLEWRVKKLVANYKQFYDVPYEPPVFNQYRLACRKFGKAAGQTMSLSSSKNVFGPSDGVQLHKKRNPYGVIIINEMHYYK